MLIGKILSNRYEIIEQIGQGGMAIVYRAKDQLLNRYVAIKVLRQEFTHDEQFIKKFKRESQAAASLSHHNIVNIYDVGVEEDIHYIVMELINGKTLKRFIQENGKVNWKQVVHITIQIASALEQAHKNHIIHRDIKPHNIIITQENVAKVADFGIARAITSSTITQVEDTMGSVHYLSPEQARGGFVNEKSDLYSLGIVIYEMVTGEVPFQGDTSVAVALKHIQEDVTPPIELNQSIPESLNSIILKLLKKNIDERYKNASALIHDLNRVYLEPEVNIMQSNFDDNAPTQVTPIIGEKSPIDKDTKEKAQPDKEEKKVGHSEKKKKWLVIVSSIMIFLIASILGALVYATNDYFAVEEIEVPTVENLTIEDAINILNNNNLEYEISQRKNHNQVEKDVVLGQNPEAGEIVKENQVIELIVSDGPQVIIIPDVVGSYEVEAINELENSGLEIGEIKYEFNDEFENGVVFKQNPNENIEVKEGTKIDLYVSKGKGTIEAPELIGETLEEAKQSLNSLGLNIGEIDYETSDAYGKDIVVNQSPKPNEEVPKNSVVDIVLSEGKIVTKNIKVDLTPYQTKNNENLDENTDEDSEEVPSRKEENVKVTIELMDNETDKTEVVYEREHSTNEGVLQIPVQGIGVQMYTIKINDENIEEGIISFE